MRLLPEFIKIGATMEVGSTLESWEIIISVRVPTSFVMQLFSFCYLSLLE